MGIKGIDFVWHEGKEEENKATAWGSDKLEKSFNFLCVYGVGRWHKNCVKKKKKRVREWFMEQEINKNSKKRIQHKRREDEFWQQIGTLLSHRWERKSWKKSNNLWSIRKKRREVCHIWVYLLKLWRKNWVELWGNGECLKSLLGVWLRQTSGE